jgi:hypothetical protein
METAAEMAAAFIESHDPAVPDDGSEDSFDLLEPLKDSIGNEPGLRL